MVCLYLKVKHRKSAQRETTYTNHPTEIFQRAKCGQYATTALCRNFTRRRGYFVRHQYSHRRSRRKIFWHRRIQRIQTRPHYRVLRAVSTNSGKILKTVYTSKTILSQSVNASMFRYVDVERLMEAEIGVTNNEPVHMAVTEAINKAVYLMILERIQENIWTAKEADKRKADNLLEEYAHEIIESNKKVAGKGYWDSNFRSKFSIGGAATINSLRGDYPYVSNQFGAHGNFKYLFSDNFNLGLSYGYQNLGSEKYFKAQFTSLEMDIEYLMMPFNNITPYLSAGFGTIRNISENSKKIQFKSQFGAGLEYMVSPSVGIRGYGKYHVGFDDDWDKAVSGKRDDHFLQFGLGVQVYLGK